MTALQKKLAIIDVQIYPSVRFWEDKYTAFCANGQHRGYGNTHAKSVDNLCYTLRQRSEYFLRRAKEIEDAAKGYR